MLLGNIIGLYAVEETDLPTLMKWRNTETFRKHFREYREINSAMQKKWFEEKVLKDDTSIMFSIRRLSDKKLLGCCGLVYINWVHRHADISLYIGLDNAYIDQEGYAEEGCRLLLDYAFDQLNLNKVWTEIYEFDEPKSDLYAKFHFKQDGLLRENYFYDGKWWNSKILSILSSDFARAKSSSTP